MTDILKITAEFKNGDGFASFDQDPTISFTSGETKKNIALNEVVSVIELSTKTQ